MKKLSGKCLQEKKILAVRWVDDEIIIIMEPNFKTIEIYILKLIFLQN